MRIVHYKLVVPVLFAGALFSSCDQPVNKVVSLVNSIQGKAYTQSGDIFAEVSANLNTATYSLASFALPIIDPGSKINYGSISIEPNVSGSGGVLSISVNVSQAARIHSSDVPKLPNGTAFPLATGKNDLIGIPIGNGGAELYLVLGPKTVLVGTAIPFSALNDVGAYIPGMNVFAPISAGPVNAYIGVFAGSAPNTTGLGVFADLSQVLPNGLGVGGTAASMIASESSASVASGVTALASSQPDAPIRLNKSLNRRDEKKLFRHLWRVGADNPTLSYE